MGRPKKKNRTRLARLYDNDITEIKNRFPSVSLADFVHVTIKTNRLIQMEAALRKPKKKYVKKK